MTLILIKGAMNAGKTLVLTYLAIKDYLKGRKIITNYDINLPSYIINKDYLEYIALRQPDTTGLSFFFDELWLWAMDSRSSMLNRILSYFFLQSSKGDTQVYLTVQRDSQLDLRVRENAHVTLTCERKLLLHNKMHNINNRIRDIGKRWYPYIYIKVCDYDNVSSGLIRYVKPRARYYLKANWIFQFYDTHKKIRPPSDSKIKTNNN